LQFRSTSEIINLFEHFLGFLGWEIIQLQDIYLHRTAHHRKIRTYNFASRGFKPTIAIIEQSKSTPSPRDHLDPFKTTEVFV
jgi:hypothetical protein